MKKRAEIEPTKQWLHQVRVAYEKHRGPFKVVDDDVISSVSRQVFAGNGTTELAGVMLGRAGRMTSHYHQEFAHRIDLQQGLLKFESLLTEQRDVNQQLVMDNSKLEDQLASAKTQSDQWEKLWYEMKADLRDAKMWDVRMLRQQLEAAKYRLSKAEAQRHHYDTMLETGKTPIELARERA